MGSDILDAHLPDYELFVIDNFSESALSEDELARKVPYKNISIADKHDLMKIFQEFKPDVVLYLATTLSKDQMHCYESNVLGMANTIEVAEKTTKPYVIYIQSFLTRNCESTITVDSSVEAKDSYATWKLATEYLLSTYSGSHTTLILASVLSPRLSVGAIPAFIERIQGNEPIKVTNTSRDYITSKVFISALTTLLLSEVKNKIEVLGSTKPINTVEILKKTVSALKQNIDSINYEIIEPKPSDPKTIIIDNSLTLAVDSENLNTDLSVNNIVTTFIKSKKNVRVHH